MQKCRCRLVTHIIGDVWAPGQGGFNVPCRPGHGRAVEPTTHGQAALLWQNFWHLQRQGQLEQALTVTQAQLEQALTATQAQLERAPCKLLTGNGLGSKELTAYTEMSDRPRPGQYQREAYCPEVHSRVPEFQPKLLLQGHRESILSLPRRALSNGFLTQN